MGAARRKIKAYKEDIAMGSVIPANALKGTSAGVTDYFVIASAARQSSALIKQAFLDCHVAALLAMTN